VIFVLWNEIKTLKLINISLLHALCISTVLRISQVPNGNMIRQCNSYMYEANAPFLIFFLVLNIFLYKLRDKILFNKKRNTRNLVMCVDYLSTQVKTHISTLSFFLDENWNPNDKEIKKYANEKCKQKLLTEKYWKQSESVPKNLTFACGYILQPTTSWEKFWMFNNRKSSFFFLEDSLCFSIKFYSPIHTCLIDNWRSSNCAWVKWCKMILCMPRSNPFEM